MNWRFFLWFTIGYPLHLGCCKFNPPPKKNKKTKTNKTNRPFLNFHSNASPIWNTILYHTTAGRCTRKFYSLPCDCNLKIWVANLARGILKYHNWILNSHVECLDTYQNSSILDKTSVVFCIHMAVFFSVPQNNCFGLMKLRILELIQLQVTNTLSFGRPFSQYNWCFLNFAILFRE